jgi:hypothetical protein
MNHTRKCRALDRSIADIRLTFSTTNEVLAKGLLAGTIADLEAEKVALHPAKV